MPILTLDNLSLAYGHHPLLHDVSLSVDRGERVCLIGRNGTGKSTLFRVITGAAHADDGVVRLADGMRVSQLAQEVPSDTHQTVYEQVSEGLGGLGRLLAAYHNAVHHVDADTPVPVDRLAELQHSIEAQGGWNIDQRVESVINRLGLAADTPIASCSGGVRRRVMLAQALVSDPDLLLLDEPTNHMDIAAIRWLEEFLLGFSGALIFITHDRTLLRRLATRIIELDRGRLTSFPGNFDTYIRRKDQLLEAEMQANARFDKKLADEEAWIRKGIQARRTRNEGRVHQLQAMREERRRRIERPNQVRLDLDRGQLSGKLVADLEQVSVGFAGEPVIRGLSTRILRGDRVGIIGPNGCGKSTLLKLILGELQPDSGRVTRGSKLEVAYFDQQRAQLARSETVRANVVNGSDYVKIGKRSKHVVGYLRDFLFPAERIDSPVESLSGGERNRLLLARLFARPANLMVLDEPTNDLDVDTLELLEDLLGDYDGTLLLVSHDRAFLDNVVTSTLAFEGAGKVNEYVGGYEDWLRHRKQAAPESASTAKPDRIATSKGSARQKLSYKEQQELKVLPKRIEELEAAQQTLEALTADPAFYRGDNDVEPTLRRLATLQEELANAYERWEHLESLDS